MVKDQLQSATASPFDAYKAKPTTPGSVKITPTLGFHLQAQFDSFSEKQIWL